MTRSDQVSSYFNSLQTVNRSYASKIVSSFLFGGRGFTKKTIFKAMDNITKYIEANGIRRRATPSHTLIVYLGQLTNHFTTEAGYLHDGELSGEVMEYMNEFSLREKKKPLNPEDLPSIIEENLAFGLFQDFNLAFGDYQLDIGTRVANNDFRNGTIGLLFRPLPKVIVPDKAFGPVRT